jgi:ectoine hydroxylase-related dioxygenase (phytanoyl-CoA dioxygenase family)
MSLSSQYALPSIVIDEYRRNGHAIVRRVAPENELNTARPQIRKIVDDVVRQKNTQGRISDYGAMFTQVTNVWRMNETVRAFVLAKRFAGIAARLMGVPSVRLYHDQALIKEPGGKVTPWHQDHYYWPLATEHSITMWMALVDIPKTMGSMNFVSGSHRSGVFKEMPISETSQEYFERVIREKQLPVESYELAAGDATFHSGRILHSAHANQSDHRREVMTVIYYADGTRIMEPDNEHRKVDLEVFHPGQKPGELAASEINPLLYP